MTQSNFDIILYGGPGAGKGSQAKLLADKLGEVAHLDMGKQLRAFAEGDSDVAREVKATIESGELIPIHITTDIVRNFITEVAGDKRIIFDGYPRSVEQARELDELLGSLGRQVKMIYIELPEAVAIDRLTKRAEIEHRADDLDKDAVQNRLDVFRRESQELTEHYKNQDSFFEINGDQAREAVAQDIFKVIE